SYEFKLQTFTLNRRPETQATSGFAAVANNCASRFCETYFLLRSEIQWTKSPIFSPIFMTTISRGHDRYHFTGLGTSAKNLSWPAHAVTHRHTLLAMIARNNLYMSIRAKPGCLQHRASLICHFFKNRGGSEVAMQS